MGLEEAIFRGLPPDNGLYMPSKISKLPDAFFAKIDQLSFDEAAELAYFGAKILHPQTVLPAKLQNIPVRLKNTMPAPLRRAIPASQAANMIIKGIVQRKRCIWVPGWVRLLYFLRVGLATQAAERLLLEAAPDIEKMFVETIATSGVKASSVAPRELARRP